MICPKCGEDNAPTFLFLRDVRHLRLEARLGAVMARRTRAGRTLRRPRRRDATTPQVSRAADRRALDAGLESPWNQSTECGSAQPESTWHGLAGGKCFLGLGFLFRARATEDRRMANCCWWCCLPGWAAQVGGRTQMIWVEQGREPAAAAPSAGETPAEPVSTKPAATDAAPAPAAGSSQTTVPSRGSFRQGCSGGSLGARKRRS